MPLKVYIKTYGCQMNERDSENIAALFVNAGHSLSDTEASADVIVLNTCSVREAAEQKALGKAGHLCARKGADGFPIVGITGCMAQNLGAEILRRVPEVDFILGTRKSADIVSHVEAVAKRRAEGQRAAKVKRRSKRYPVDTSHADIDISDDEFSHNAVKHHLDISGRVCAYVSIMQGCAMNCSYCIVPQVRGPERSRPIEDIVDEVKLLAERGVKEVTLLGQVVNAYGRGSIPYENGVSPFVRLLRRINDVEGISRIRFVSPHPSYFRQDLINAYGELEKLCEYVHLPLQSGSDRILKAMNRPYRADKFMRIADSLRAVKPNMSISTDIIVGYPGETDEDFEMTKSLFERAGFDMAYIFKYSPRPGTKSAQLADDIAEEVKENRNQALLELLAKQSQAYNDRFVGKTVEVLVEDAAKRGEALKGFTREHRKVVLTGGKVGFCNVHIERATVTTLEGRAV